MQTLPSIRIDASTQTSGLALGWFHEEKEKGKGSGSGPIFVGKKSKDSDNLAHALKTSSHFFGKKNETSLLRYFSYDGYPSVLLVGLGTVKKWSSEIARQAGAAVYLAQKKERLQELTVDTDSFFAKVKEKDEYLQAFCEGYLIAGYKYSDILKDEKKDGADFHPTGIRLTEGKSAQKAIDRAVTLAGGINFARHLGDRPSNLLTPTEFARLVSEASKKKGFKCTVLGKKEIEKEKMGLFLGVAQGATEEPKFLVLEYGKKTDKPIVLVGKGVTFDTGGISLKPSDRMDDMKYDMMGAAAVAGVFYCLNDLKVSRSVVGLIPLTENMPDGNAQKPGDVKKSLSGKTVEITNTDAEGRLVLADALDYAQKEYQPEAMLDFATLTGAVVVALGSVTTGIMGNHPGLIQRIEASSEATGERVWELPLYDEYEDDMKSNFADYRNSGTREAGSSKGGVFLRFFVKPEIPWVHFDVAGAAYHRKDVNYHPHKYGAGVMVRLVSDLLENWKPLKN